MTPAAAGEDVTVGVSGVGHFTNSVVADRTEEGRS